MRRLGWAVAVMATAVLGGCGSDDSPTKPPPGLPKYDRTTPQNTLETMQTAYIARDSTETKAVYDTSYVGTSTDLNDPPETQVSTFRFADEAAHVAALARSNTIVGIVLDLGLKSSWTRMASDDPSHPEWAMIQVATWRVEIYDGSTAYSTQAINPLTFAFTPTVTAPGDTTWKIVRWTEVGSGF